MGGWRIIISAGMFVTNSKAVLGGKPNTFVMMQGGSV